MGVALFAGEFLWLTTDEAARRLEMTAAGVAAAVRDGRLPAERFGREIAVRDCDVEAFKKKMGRTGRPASGYSRPR